METATGLVFIFIGVVIFLFCREFTTWYFKFNAIVDLLQSIDSRLKGIQKDNEAPKVELTPAQKSYEAALDRLSGQPAA